MATKGHVPTLEDESFFYAVKCIYHSYLSNSVEWCAVDPDRVVSRSSVVRICTDLSTFHISLICQNSIIDRTFGIFFFFKSETDGALGMEPLVISAGGGID